MAHALSVYADQRVGGLTLRCPLLFQLPGFDPNAISVVGKHIGKRNFPHGIRHGFGHWSIRIFENVVDIPSHGACVIPSLVDADHIIEVRGFHCLMDIEQSDFLGGVRASSAPPVPRATVMSPARLSAPKALRMLTAFVPVLSESSALGADRYFDYRIENYAEALSDAPVDHVIDTLGETAKLLSGWSDRASLR